MGRFSEEIRINAPKEKVWEVLADLGNIYQWNLESLTPISPRKASKVKVLPDTATLNVR